MYCNTPLAPLAELVLAVVVLSWVIKCILGATSIDKCNVGDVSCHLVVPHNVAGDGSLCCP